MRSVESSGPGCRWELLAESFRTYIPVSTDGKTYKLEAHPFPDYPFRVRAVSPTGTLVTVAVAPSDEDTSQWLGQFTPDQTGSWTLHIVNLADADAACYSDMPLAVTTQTSTGSSLIYARPVCHPFLWLALLWSFGGGEHGRSPTMELTSGDEHPR